LNLAKLRRSSFIAVPSSHRPNPNPVNAILERGPGFLHSGIAGKPPLVVKRMCDAWLLSWWGGPGFALQELTLPDYQMLQQRSKMLLGKKNMGRK